MTKGIQTRVSFEKNHLSCAWKKQQLTTSAVGAAVGFLAQTNSCLADTWQLGNGEVRLNDPVRFGVEKLERPRFLGSGGGGAVFQVTPSGTSFRNDVALKVSWLRSTASVEKECKVLQALEASKVQGVETCLGMEKYPDDSRRVMIAMQPVIENSVAAVTQIDKELQAYSATCIVRTMVQMLAAGIVTIDVQPLISTTTGDVLFIDMTEAKVLVEPWSFLDNALASSFCTEMLSLIPESLYPVASEAFLKELQAIEARDGSQRSNEFFDVLGSQTQFMSQECLDYIDAKKSPE